VGGTAVLGLDMVHRVTGAYIRIETKVHGSNRLPGILR
jgi:hypothetical protein